MGLDAFLKVQPGMHVRPSQAGLLRLEGEFRFRAFPRGGEVIEDAFVLQIDVPEAFPDKLPAVMELGLRIPRHADAHVNTDGTMCLGSPLRLLLKAREAPSLCGFADGCIVPALYNAAHRERYRGAFPFGELAHGFVGELDDYRDLFGVRTLEQILYALELAGMKRRLANKRPCPCGCGRRLGVCKTNKAVREVRGRLGRRGIRRFTEGLRSYLGKQARLIREWEQRQLVGQGGLSAPRGLISTSPRVLASDEVPHGYRG